MSVSPIESCPMAQTDGGLDASELRQKFLNAASELVAPFALRLNLSLTLIDFDSQIHEITQELDSSTPLFIEDWELICRGVELGRLRLQGLSQVESRDVDLIKRMVDASVRQAENSCIEDELLIEICDSHERLRAVYEISSQMVSARGEGDLLDQILNRASAIQKGLKAVLWIERDNQLEPVQAPSETPLTPRELGTGLVGKSLANGSPTVIKARKRLEAVADTEPELKYANSVMIAPVETKQGQRAALELWSEGDDDADFGSPTMHLALSVALQAAMVVENERMHKAALENERLLRELEIGSRIQQTLLLSAPPKELSGALVASLSISSRTVDGDFIEFFRHDNRCFDMIVGDVMGKGIPAALLGAGAKSEFHRAMSHLLFLDNTRFPEPASIVQQTHSQMVNRMIALESFITLCYARIDIRRQELTMVDCGHTATIHYQRARNRCALLQGDNVPMGFSEREEYTQLVVNFKEGDWFVFYSDGLTEAKNDSGEMFGEERLCRLIETNRDTTPEHLLKVLEQTVVEFSKDGILNDDMTCVVIKIASEEFSPVRQAVLEVTSQPKELTRIRKFVHEVCRDQSCRSWTEDQLYQLEVAVNEAATNIMEHAYLWKADRWIRIELNANQNQIEVILTHDGKSFDPRGVEPPRFDGSRDGGFGLLIINSYVDEVLYTRDESGANRVRLTKKRTESPRF